VVWQDADPGDKMTTIEERPEMAINRPGLAHLIFEVDKVEAARDNPKKQDRAENKTL
jgi:hypothetical protein